MSRDATPWYQWRGEDLLLRVWAQPRARQDGIVGLQDNCLKIKVTAAPADGQANTRIAALLAAALGVPGAMVSLQAGARCRRKTFVIKGLAGKLAAGTMPERLLPS